MVYIDIFRHYVYRVHNIFFRDGRGCIRHDIFRDDIGCIIHLLTLFSGLPYIWVTALGRRGVADTCGRREDRDRGTT